MKRALSLLCVFILMLSLVTGCSSAKKDASNTSSSAQKGKAEVNMNNSMVAADMANPVGAGAEAKSPNGQRESALSDSTALTVTSISNSLGSNSILSQRKIIRNANVSVEVEEFDKAYGQIKSMISAFGYIQESNIKKDKIYVNSKVELTTRGTIIIRVEKDKFENILTDVKGLGFLLDESIKSDDVTDKFYDTESMLRLLKYEQSRLEEYLLKITDPDVIFKTQSRLTEIRHEIEKLTGTLNKWNDLVELSTITINLTEKTPGGEQIPKQDSYWTKLSSSFAESIKGVISFCGGLLIVIVQAIPILILLAMLALVAFWVYRKFFKNLKIENKKDTDLK